MSYFKSCNIDFLNNYYKLVNIKNLIIYVKVFNSS
jgi:hypothetical protein